MKIHSGRIALAVVMSMLVTRAFADVVIYQDSNFKGPTYSSQSDVSNLARVGFNDKASSIEVYNDSWELCSDADFGGNCVTLRPGQYGSLSAEGLNDRVSSIRRARHGGGGSGGGGHGIVLYQDDNFQGRALSVNNAEPDLKNEGLNDSASSLEIKRGSWDLCSDANFRGQCVTLQQGRYPSLRAEGLNDKVSSVRPSSGSSYQYGNSHQGSGQSPQVLILKNGNGQVTIPATTCTVYYNKQGNRMSNMPGCTPELMREADSAMSRYRHDQGSGGGPAAQITHDEYDDAGDAGVPQVIVGTNGEGEVAFQNNCVVYYNATGRRTRNLPACSRDQLGQADREIATYRREQGL